MKTFIERWRPPVAGLVVAVGAGALCSWLRTPLPWMIGPLFSVAPPGTLAKKAVRASTAASFDSTQPQMTPLASA